MAYGGLDGTEGQRREPKKKLEPAARRAREWGRRILTDEGYRVLLDHQPCGGSISFFLISI